MAIYSTQPLTLLGSADSNISSFQSTFAFVGDALSFSLSIQSSNASASRWTIMGSNADGFQSSLPLPTVSSVNSAPWSIITTITSQGLVVFDTGYRWLCAFRAPWDVGGTGSTSSNVTIVLNQQVNY